MAILQSSGVTRGQQAMVAWYERVQASLRVPYESITVPTRFGSTHLIAVGEKWAPPLVLVQGMGSNAMLWEPQLADLSRTHRVYALDVIGQMGKSATTWLSYRDNSFSEWLVDTLNVLGIDRTDMVGLSFGARLVMRFSAFAPQRVRRIALLSPIGIAMQRLSIISRILPIAVDLQKPSDKTIDTLVHAILDVPGHRLDETCAEAMQIVFKHYRPVAGLKKIFDGLALFFPLPTSELQRIIAPTLLLVGEHEQLCNAPAVIGRGRRLLSHLVAAELVPKAGHVMNYDCPEYVNSRLINFFSSTV